MMLSACGPLPPIRTTADGNLGSGGVGRMLPQTAVATHVRVGKKHRRYGGDVGLLYSLFPPRRSHGIIICTLAGAVLDPAVRKAYNFRHGATLGW